MVYNISLFFMLQDVKLDIEKLEKDYWEWILRDYMKTRDYTKTKYISNPYKTFMKTIKWIEEYKMEVVKKTWRYWAYILPLIDAASDVNYIDMNMFQEKNKISDNQIARIKSTLLDANVLRKRGNIFYLNPLIAFSGKDISIELWELFSDELEKVGILNK